MFKLFAKRAPIFENLQYHAILSGDLVNKHYLQVMTAQIGLIVQISGYMYMYEPSHLDRLLSTKTRHSLCMCASLLRTFRPRRQKCTSRFCGYVWKNYLTPRYQPCGKPVPDGLQIWSIQGRVYLCTTIKIINWYSKSFIPLYGVFVIFMSLPVNNVHSLNHY